MALPKPSSGQSKRYRLKRRGKRRPNAALHRIAVSERRRHEPAQRFVARKHAAGKSTGEALRCLERHLARTVWQYNLEAVKRTAASKWTVDAKRGAAQRYILMAPSGRTP